MKVCDYIAGFIRERGISDVFGYPGGMVTYLMDAFDKAWGITQHLAYHEQAAAFNACGYAQASGKPGVAYATSGPGATNLLTGIANAYFDSIPTVFLTGQVNRDEASRPGMKARQHGFQETDIVSIARPVTKYSAYVRRGADIRVQLEQAFHYAAEGRKGPCLLDIPIDVLREEVEPERMKPFTPPAKNEQTGMEAEAAGDILESIRRAQRPVIHVGNGVNIAGARDALRGFVRKCGVPVVSSMISVDLLASDDESNFGFVGAYGHRYANHAIYNSDLVVALGTRMDVRQTGAVLRDFTRAEKIIRVDIDEGELDVEVSPAQKCYAADLKYLMPMLEEGARPCENHEKWQRQCRLYKEKLRGYDAMAATDIVREISERIPDGSIVTTDVGQNQVWVAQAFRVRQGQRVLFSGGHGAMGYSLPAAIGAHYATGKPVYCFCGDGGIQMNIQELQFLARERLPVKIILMNNSSLGMIRHFQEMYFENRCAQTVRGAGYDTPDFIKVAEAYGIAAARMGQREEVNPELLRGDGPALLEVVLDGPTHVFPKLAFGKPLCEQEPPLGDDLKKELEMHE